MTIDQLEMIEAIVNEGSFHAAAKRLNKSQPSLSVGVKKIEETYNIELFNRETYRPQLTPSGSLFFKLAQDALSSFRDLEKLSRELGSGKESQITIALDPLVSSNKLLPLLRAAQPTLGLTPIHFEDQILNDPIESVLAGKCNFAIGHLGDQPNKEIEYKDFCEVELQPVISKKLLSGKKITKELLRRYPNIVVETNQSLQNSRTTTSTSHQWSVSTHARKEDMILAGLGWGRLAAAKLQTSSHKDKLITIPKSLVAPFKLSIHLIRHRKHPMGPIAKQMWNEFSST